jgi:alkylation response protein AidB-like acyl-CoA dehydrogenase
VFVPKCFKRPYKLFTEGEWVALTADPEMGGQGLPNIIAQATNAEHDMVENIINLVLARIDDASKGTKGVSLYVVPKIWVNEDGTLGESNDAICTSIEHKLGINASATCAMSFGSQGKCRGVLLGEENNGM